MSRIIKEAEAHQCWCPMGSDADQKCQGRKCAMWEPYYTHNSICPYQQYFPDQTYWVTESFDESQYSDETGNVREREIFIKQPRSFWQWVLRRPHPIEKKVIKEKEWVRAHLGFCGFSKNK